MLRILAIGLALLALAPTCAPLPTSIPVVEPVERPVSFLHDVKPILDRRCVVCHACYNAPCQLKLSSFEGAERGGSKQAVYSSSRLIPQSPSRLFFDAPDTEGWRKRGFHSVLESRATPPLNDSVMLYLLEAKRRLPTPE